MRQLPATFGLFDVVDDLFKGSLQGRDVRTETLRVDIVESPEQYTIHADVPGVPKENIKVEFDKGTLTIQVSERSKHEVKEGETVVRSERVFSKKQRSFDLLDSVDESKIEAEYKDGVLVLVLPKKESARVVKQIEIK